MKKYQLKIMIKNSKPPVWRRCIVPSNITFAQLETILNVVMGWKNDKESGFEFYYRKLVLSKNKQEEAKMEYKNSNEEMIDCYMEEDEWFTYTYNLEQPCQHRVEIEEVVEEDTEEAKVIKFKGNWPVEDEEEYQIDVVNNTLKELAKSQYKGTEIDDQIGEQLHNVIGQLFSKMNNDETIDKEKKEKQKNILPDAIQVNRMNTALVQSKNTKTIYRVEKKIYPNDPCFCGSGKKYKHCCKNK